MSLGLNATEKLYQKNKKFIQKEIPKLNNNEYREIFNIIKKTNRTKYSENSRGVYINLKYIDNNTIDKIIEFIEYCKSNKTTIDDISSSKEIESKKTNNNISCNSKKYTLDKDSIEKELLRLRDKNSDNFSFQNFLDKLSVTNIKNFNENNNEKINYPQLKNCKCKFDGVKARILQKCRDASKTVNDLQPFVINDDIKEINYDVLKNENIANINPLNFNDNKSINEDFNIEEDDNFDLNNSDNEDDELYSNIDELDEMDNIHHIANIPPKISKS